jgi:hypothetical protein
MSLAHVLLERLDRVRAHGKGWQAQCPSHEGKSGSSLSVSETNETVLIKCWGGCSAHEVLGAVGLEFQDLYPPRITPDMPLSKRITVRAKLNDRARLSRVKAAASALDNEAVVVGIFARKIQTICESWGRLIRHDMADGDIERFRKAQDQIHRIKADLNGL